MTRRKLHNLLIIQNKQTEISLHNVFQFILEYTDTFSIFYAVSVHRQNIK